MHDNPQGPSESEPEPVTVQFDEMAPEAFRHAQRILGQLMLRNRSRKLWIWWGIFAVLSVALAIAIARTLMGQIGSSV